MKIIILRIILGWKYSLVLKILDRLMNDKFIMGYQIELVYQEKRYMFLIFEVILFCVILCFLKYIIEQLKYLDCFYYLMWTSYLSDY